MSTNPLDYHLDHLKEAAIGAVRCREAMLEFPFRMRETAYQNAKENLVEAAIAYCNAIKGEEGAKDAH